MPDYPLPSFLAPRADEHEYDTCRYDEYEEQSALEHELRDNSGLIRASIITVAVAIGGIVLAVSLGHPVKVLADATVSLSDKQGSAGARSGADAPPVQSSTDSSTPAAGGALTREDLAALAELTNQVRAEDNAAASGALLQQFQAWAAKQDAEAQFAKAEPPVQPIEAAPVQIARDDPAPEELAQRRERSVENARAEMPHVQKPKAKVQRKLAARRQAAPIQDARALPQPVLNANAPQSSFLQGLGWNQ